MTEKPKKPRRQRVDSPAGVAAAIISGGKKITLPAGTTFTATERKVFTELCDEFSKTELTAHKIRLLVMLARDLVAVNREQVLLSREGVVLINSHGNAYPNPRTKVCSGLLSAILSMRRSLGIHTRALEGGSNQKAAVRRAQAFRELLQHEARRRRSARSERDPTAQNSGLISPERVAGRNSRAGQ